MRFLHFAPDGKSILVGSEGGVAIRDSRSGELQVEWRGAFAAAAFAPGGEQVALIGGAGHLILSDRSGGQGAGLRPRNRAAP